MLVSSIGPLLVCPSVCHKIEILIAWPIWVGMEGYIYLQNQGDMLVMSLCMCTQSSTHASMHAHYFLACLGLNLSQIGSDQRDQSIYGIKEHAGLVWAHNVTWACKLVCMQTMWLLVILISFICARLWIEMLNWPIWTKIWFQSKSLRKSLVPLRLRQNPSYSWAELTPIAIEIPQHKH